MRFLGPPVRLSACLVLLAACSRENPPPPYQAVAVAPRDIIVSANASGTVQPDTTVEVKTRAAGEVLEMKAETGQTVKRGALLLRIDPRQLRNAVAQAQADLEAALAQQTTTQAQRARAEELFTSGAITAQDRENVQLSHANAKAAVVRARVALENARIQLEDTDVRAPIDGTIIEKGVERGSVIASATQNVGGGTTLLKMADLDLVQVTSQVDETDIGKVEKGQRATVTVDAYPNRPFEGTVLKIEPQAVVNQNITTFPVRIRIDNKGGLLRPGMNADVEIHVGERHDVLAVPNAALRTQRDVGSAAQVLGLDARDVQEKLAQGGQAGGPAGRRAGGRGDTAVVATRDMRTERMPARAGSSAPARPARPPAQTGRYIVFVRDSGGPRPVWVTTGLTDLDYTEVVDGLSAGDSVLVLPSASLVQSQQEMRERMNRVTGGGGLPGMRQQTAPATGPAAGAAAPLAALNGRPMLLGEIIAAALQSIRANALRSMLTMLGIVIGVAAVITMLALGRGAQKAVEDRIAALGANVFTVFAGQARSGMVRIADATILSTDDYAALQRDATLLSAVVPEMSQNSQVKYGNQNANLQVVGTTPEYLPVRNYTVPYGRMFTAGDDGARRRYALLGASVPQMLGGNPAAMINQTLDIGGVPFEIIGVLSEKGAAGGFMNPDEQILIPLNTAQFRLFGTKRLRSLALEVQDGVPIEQGMVDVERVLRREHRIRPGQPNDFTIRDQRDLLTTQQQATEVFTYLLASIAAVSLLVGGIGIMNIMLVSVTERTREIGVRMALGATRGNIQLQFLIEAMVLCIAGGVLGIVLGTGAAVALSRFLQWNTLISPYAVAVAFVFSAAVGLFFGIWPARRAARLDPVVALRYE